MQLQLKINKNKTLRESIVDSVRDSIMRGALKPGLKISEPALATQFGISRTPVREAIRQLDSEGFLTVLPRRGARVASMSEKDIREFYDVKAVLESHAAELATPKISEKDLNKMEELNKQMEEANWADEYRRVFRLHNEFHEVFIRAAGNEQLDQLIRTLVAKFQRFRILLTIADKREGALSQHREIIKAFRDRDAKKAALIVGQNASLGKEVIINEILSAMR